MRDKWREMIFEEVVDINPQRKILRGEIVPHISMDIIQPFTRTINHFEMKEFKGSGSRFQNGDTLLARITPCLENGKTALVNCLPDNTVGHGSTEFIVLSGKEGISDNLFVYYLSRASEFRNFAIQQMEGSTGRQRVPAKALSKLSIDLPHLPEQKAIASILGSLDDKIELNRKMNETLEAMAKAIFKSWFIDFDPIPGLGPHKEWQDSPLEKIPKGWRVESIGNIIELAYGKALKEDVRQLGKIPVYGSNGQVGWHNEKLVDGPGIVVGRKGNPGIIKWLTTDFYPIDTTFYIVPKGLIKSMLYLFHALKLQDLPSLGADSAVPGLNRNMAYMNKMLVPSPDIVSAFDDQVKPLAEKINQNINQSRTIAAIRDALLPKLLSGDIQIQEDIINAK